MSKLTSDAGRLTLEGVDNVEGGDSLALCVLGVRDGVTDDTLEEGLEDTTSLLVDHGGDTLDTTTTGETADRGLGDTLDVVAKNLAVTLGTALAEALATFAAWRCVSMVLRKTEMQDAAWRRVQRGGTYVQSC